MHKNCVRGFDSPVCPPLVAGLFQFTRTICDKQIWSFIAWPFLSVLYTQRETCIDKCDNRLTKPNGLYTGVSAVWVSYICACTV